MATDIIPTENVASIPAKALEPLAPELRPNIDHIVTEDNTPVDNVFSEKQQRLLLEPLFSSWIAGRPFVAMSNVGLFYAVKNPPYVPDVMLSVDVKLPGDPRPKENRSYFVWEYGKPPDVVIEVVSNNEGGEDSEKLVGYARIGVANYVIFDPFKMISSEFLRTYRKVGSRYERIDNGQIFDDIAVGLKLWQGEFEGWNQQWLRWIDSQGTIIPTGAEQAIALRHLADQHRQLADQQQQRADAIAQKLRELGVDPDSD